MKVSSCMIIAIIIAVVVCYTCNGVAGQHSMADLLRMADSADATTYMMLQQQLLGQQLQQQQQQASMQDAYPYAQRFFIIDDTPTAGMAAATPDMYGNNDGMAYNPNMNIGVPDGYGIKYDDLVYPTGGDGTQPSASSSTPINDDDGYCQAVGKEFGCNFGRKSTAEDKCLRCATTGAVDVDGEASVSLTTNLTRIQLGVEFQGSNTTSASDVQNEVSRRAAAVVKILQDEPKVTELSTTAITLSRQYQWINSQNQFIGYLATNMVSFLLSGTSAGGIIDACVNAGATRIDSISFEAPAADVLAARKKALTNAIKDAREKAMLIAGTIGVNLLIPPRIDLYQVTAPPSTKFSTMEFARAGGDFAMPMAAPMPASPLIPGKQVITATIRIAFQYTSTTTSDRLPLPKTTTNTDASATTGTASDNGMEDGDDNDSGSATNNETVTIRDPLAMDGDDDTSDV